MKFFKALFTWIWCFPQMLVGLCVRIGTKAKKQDGYYVWGIKGYGLSLGTFIFVPEKVSDNVIKHEQGHTKQSYMLGWLYLIVIGLPSVIWCHCFKKFRNRHGIKYSWFYTEVWADKLGNVK